MEHEMSYFCHIMFYEFRNGLRVETSTKKIRDVNIYRASTLQAADKRVGRFHQGDFNQKDQKLLGRPFNVQEDSLLLSWRINS